MRRLVFVFGPLLIVFSSAPALGRQAQARVASKNKASAPAAQETKQPTLQETTDWISARILAAGYGYTYFDDTGHLYRSGAYGDSSASFEDCEMKYQFTDRTFDPSNPQNSSRANYNLSVKLRLLTAPLFKTNAFTAAGLKDGPKELSTLTLRAQSTKAPAIVGSFTLNYATNPSTTEPLNDKDYVLNIPFTDKDMGARMYKAFQHAITLCGGGKPPEKEPF
jgi:hypothetical protein